MHLRQDELQKQLNEAAKLVKVGGVYSHYKNPEHHYKILHLAITEADDKICVVYQACYGEKLIFVRPITSWLEEVSIDDKKSNRFELLA